MCIIIMCVLLQKGCDLGAAAMSCNEAVVKELISLGVDVDSLSAVSFVLLRIIATNTTYVRICVYS